MPLTIVVKCASREPAAEEASSGPGELSITFDSPRIVIGRGDAADLRLPDPSVSHRHASVRARGAEWVLIDEGSTNGTFLDTVRLAPQSPRVVQSGEMVRVGRVWLELRIEHASMPTARAPAAAKELALELVSRALASEGEDARPSVRVAAGPDAGKELRLEPRRTYLVGRAREADLALEDADASRRHVELSRRGDQVFVQDLGSKVGTTLGDEPLGTQPSPWPPGRDLSIGSDRLVLANAAADALAELERSPDERMDPAETIEAPSPPGARPGAAVALLEEPAPARSGGAHLEARADDEDNALEPRGWSLTDGAVLLFSLGVLVLSVAGLIWLLGR